MILRLMLTMRISAGGSGSLFCCCIVCHRSMAEMYGVADSFSVLFPAIAQTHFISGSIEFVEKVSGQSWMKMS